jgi:phosphoglycolate phosphatase-like HAD superfamily hydrolase
MSIKKILVISASIISLSFIALKPKQASAQGNSSYIFFDLGEVLVHTEKTPQEDGTVKKVISWIPGAKEHLDNLKQGGYRLGIMSNIPTAWGDAPSEWGTPCESMFRRLDDYMKKYWQEDMEPFDWSYFDQIILPPTEQERKPHPFMYQNALGFACPNKMLYIGDGADEVEQALSLKLSGWLVDPTNEEFFLHHSKIPQHIEEEYSYQHQLPCQRQMPRECSLDQDHVINVISRNPIPVK